MMNYKSFKNANKKYNPRITAERGDTVKIASVASREQLEIKVTDQKNPFYLKSLNDIVMIKGESYKVVKVIKWKDAIKASRQ